ncbi:MAG: ABC transporter ATP-binding protein [Yaniella sp.]|uniref:ABC transporter ATP-binding protein n=1 Tax=Yaniella sp. TaxID=2773929 RepID=UPI002649F91C|nr:ABC transporter ATP-binding protein [Yaniella sp.]MDN5815021.1 ABC transporter ATP-binding protein/permease [Yaniella sp.]MDN5889591.1 ABC transporter ATP-binding protein/permease [Yaniella sp.]MDN5911981.1 ABC transporter ATP-binding protein/permease [Yaniella sp.]
MSGPGRTRGSSTRYTQMTKEERRASLRLLGSLLKPYKWQLVGLSTIVVLAQLASVASPAIIAWGIDNGIPALLEGNATPAVAASVAHIAAALVGGGLMYVFIRWNMTIGQHMLFGLRKRLFLHSQRLDMKFHETYASGRTVARQTSDMDALANLLNSGLDIMVGSVLQMVFTMVLIVTMDVPSGVVMAGLLIPATMLTIWFQKRSSVIYRQIQTNSARLISHFVETVSGIRAVKSYRRQRANGERYEQLAEDHRQSSLRSIQLFGIYQPTLRWLSTITIAAVLTVGGFRVLGDELQVGVLVALVLYARRFFQPIDEIANFYNTFQSAVAALEKISGLMAEESSVTDPEDPVELADVQGEIVFDDVSFRYDDELPLALHPTSLHVPAGQTVAIVGSTGAGKSTIAKLMARFYDVTDGSITLDGVNLKDLDMETLTDHIVMVTQESYLFSGSVANNIALGNPEASREEIEAAAAIIGADTFIQRLPQGFDTDVRARGGRMSAGQRQLVSFARAFLADPNVLILDEATSSLDAPTEAMVQEGLEELLGKRTSFIIAHRLSTVMIADRVLVVEGGQIIEDGAPDELIAAGGQFSELHQAWQDTLTE